MKGNRTRGRPHVQGSFFNRKGTWMTFVEVGSLLGAAKAHSERDHLLLLCGFWHGLRASEICALRGSDIQDGLISVKRLKGSLHTTQDLVSCDDPLFDEKPLLEKLAAEKGSGLLFDIGPQRLDQIIKKYGKEAGIEHHRLHTRSLKHSLAHFGVERGMGIEDLRQLLGHKSMASTGEYLKKSDAQACAALRAAMGKKEK